MRKIPNGPVPPSGIGFVPVAAVLQEKLHLGLNE
jgi:hypothetical protein